MTVYKCLRVSSVLSVLCVLVFLCSGVLFPVFCVLCTLYSVLIYVQVFSPSALYGRRGAG